MVEQNILLQDNKSTIRLATNGRWSSSKSTFFLVKDRVDNGELEGQSQNKANHSGYSVVS